MKRNLANIAKKLIIINISFLLAFIFTGCSKKIDLNKYISVSTSGYDSIGKAQVVFDKEQFIEDNSGRLTFDITEMSSGEKAVFLEFVRNMGARSAGINKLFNTFDWKLDKKDNLSNGDIITISWNCKDDVAEEVFGARLLYSDIQHEVTNLKEVETFDPFDRINVSFLGMAPDAKVSVDIKDTQYSYDLSYSINPGEGLSNGDVVTATVKLAESKEEFVEKYGVLPSPMSKEYNVSGLTSNITCLSQISKDVMEDMKAEGEKVIGEDPVWDDKHRVKDVQYMGSYFLTEKWTETDANRCYQIYKVIAEIGYPENSEENGNSSEQSIDEFEYYTYVRFSNLRTDEIGNDVSDLSNTEVPDHLTAHELRLVAEEGSEKTRFRGYADPRGIRNGIVSSNSERYYFESTEMSDSKLDLSDRGDGSPAFTENVTTMISFNLMEPIYDDVFECEVGMLVEFDENDVKNLKVGDVITSLGGNEYTIVESPDGDDTENVIEIGGNPYVITRDETGDKLIARSYYSYCPVDENVHTEILHFSDDVKVSLDRFSHGEEKLSMTISGADYKELCREYEQEGIFQYNSEVEIQLYTPQWGYAKIEDDRITYFEPEYNPI